MTKLNIGEAVRDLLHSEMWRKAPRRGMDAAKWLDRWRRVARWAPRWALRQTLEDMRDCPGDFDRMAYAGIGPELDPLAERPEFWLAMIPAARTIEVGPASFWAAPGRVATLDRLGALGVRFTASRRFAGLVSESAADTSIMENIQRAVDRSPPGALKKSIGLRLVLTMTDCEAWQDLRPGKGPLTPKVFAEALHRELSMRPDVQDALKYVVLDIGHPQAAPFSPGLLGPFRRILDSFGIPFWVAVKPEEARPEAVYSLSYRLRLTEAKGVVVRTTQGDPDAQTRRHPTQAAQSWRVQAVANLRARLPAYTIAVEDSSWTPRHTEEFLDAGADLLTFAGTLASRGPRILHPAAPEPIQDADIESAEQAAESAEPQIEQPVDGPAASEQDREQ